MPNELPPRASLEFLRKLAKDRLAELRRQQPEARLADVQLAIARQYGFRSWRALKAELDRRSTSPRDAFFAACRTGDLAVLQQLLRSEPALVHARSDDGATCLHRAVQHPEAVRLLLQFGADPNARDSGDNALPLHFAAAGGPVETVRLLLDAGSGVQGEGDAHNLDTIGWATVFEAARRDVVELLVEHGARHHVFSAIALNDVPLLRRIVLDDPRALERRLSLHEQEQTALHYVVAPADGVVGGLFRTGAHYATLDALIELGADLEARDARGRTALEIAMLRGDTEVMRRLHAAGAQLPPTPPRDEKQREPAPPVGPVTPMLAVGDMAATIAWYREVGFTLTGSHGDDGRLDWAEVSLGSAFIMFTPSENWRTPTSSVSLWFRTDRLDELHAALRARQLARARALLTHGQSDVAEVRFTRDLYTAFYGQREFAIRDPNGVELNFYQPLAQEVT